MLHAETVAVNCNDIVRKVLHAIRTRTGPRVNNLDVDCDGEVITVRGKVSTYYAWQLGFSAARNASSELGGLLLDYQVKAGPAQVID